MRINDDSISTRTTDGLFFAQDIPDFAPSSQRRLIDLFELVFDHQIAVYPKTNLTINSTPVQKIAQYFYNEESKCYLLPKIHNGDSENTTLVETDDFIDIVCENDFEPTRNHLFYLQGRVGSGKSALISYIISRKLHNKVDQGNIWFARVDLERVAHDLQRAGESHIRIPSRKFIVRDICAKIIQVFEENFFDKYDFKNDRVRYVYKQLRRSYNNRSTDYLELVTLLSGLITEVYNINKRRFLLILDNIDYLTHINDRVVFYNRSITGDEEVFDVILDVLSAFNHPEELGRLGGNILVVLRPDTMNLMRQIVDNRVSIAHRRFSSFTLALPDWKEVIKGRLELLKFATNLEKLAGRTKEYEKRIENFISEIAQSIDRGEDRYKSYTLIEHIFKLSNNNLRTMVSFLADYSWIPDEKSIAGDALSRYLHTVPVGLIAYILGRKRLFHQFTSRFPNIYLINALRNPDGNDHEHMHTYWLKRLMFNYLHSHHIAGRRVDPEKLIRDFSNGDDGYDESLVRIVLGSLLDVASGLDLAYAIRIRSRDFPNKLYISDIKLNDRGIHCAKYIFEEFFYLQLVIDDHLLPVPNCVLPDFKYLKLRPSHEILDYSYLIANQAAYSERAHEMIGHKIKQVLLFVKILEVALDLEKTKHKSIFAKLEALEVELPNIDKMRAKTLREINAVSRNVDIASEINRVNRYEKGIVEELRSAYQIPTPKKD